MTQTSHPGTWTSMSRRNLLAFPRTNWRQQVFEVVVVHRSMACLADARDQVLLAVVAEGNPVDLHAATMLTLKRCGHRQPCSRGGGIWRGLFVLASAYFWPHSRQRPEGPSVFGPIQSTVVRLP
jgi:hypothetical protein